jgi:hypothetical protein
MTRKMKPVFGLLCAFILSTLGCQSAPKRYDNVSEGQWRAKALIRDQESARSYIVNLNLNLVRDQRARMDVTTALGTGVASLVVDPKEVRYVIVDSKRFYFGVPNVNVMRPILAIPFDPRWLNNLLFEIPITDKGWTCTNEGEVLKECRDAQTGLKITWSDRHGERKTVRMEHATASVQIKVQSFRPKVEERKNLFLLEPPEGYKKLRVR